MATAKRAPTKDLAQVFQFDPHIIYDPVPWPYIVQFLDKNAAAKVAQLEIDLHTAVLKARLDAANRLGGLLRG